ncbi:hypothetical protein GQ54DRAFT_302399 [Martensiomyces pterosporus]|nr:hypothetical protein GQ54DRAFT_302399 [Martensiomyces pterosporus]
MSQFAISAPPLPSATPRSSHVTPSSSVSSLSSTLGARSFTTSAVREKDGASEKQHNTDLEKGAVGEAGRESGKADGKKPGKFRVLMQQYGRVAIVAYLTVTAVDLMLCIWGVWLGGDGLVFKINSYLGQYIPRLQKAAEKMKEGESGGSDKWVTIIIVAYAVHKCLTPLRLAVTAAILPWSARSAQRLGWTWLIPKSAPPVTAKPMSRAADVLSRKLK